MHDIGAAHHANVLAVSPQAGSLRVEVRIIWIDRPNDFPGKIHNNFKSRAAGLANHPTLAVVVFYRGFWSLMGHDVSLSDEAW